MYGFEIPFLLEAFSLAKSLPSRQVRASSRNLSCGRVVSWLQGHAQSAHCVHDLISGDNMIKRARGSISSVITIPIVGCYQYSCVSAANVYVV